ncbi:DUF2935 domain-containing protein [Clostridium botulinum]|uniref:DUF2935 domain-containing protein n=1 Tax=Clostridium botulinum TaxID=1491 RepID=A0AA44BQE9_CLOBO|nr:DUF2935 domain-containing protein [Clostridium botulinum]NFI19866.1 DUF2935 domain-containing protein [Clostridium botulinum]NFQ80025.1 DUF2935 domain-containing protein [Clostridium botulinum]
MKISNIKEITLFEHHFWLQILGDHSRFILNSLSPKEKSFIEEANRFKNLFDNLLKKSKQSLSEEELFALNNHAYNAAMKIREFKLDIIDRQITDKIVISLPPTFINHMVNEVDEYIFILTKLMKGNVSNIGPIHLHLLWLPDGAGHASNIASSLDITEKELIKKSNQYSKKFNNLYLRTIEYNGYTRTGICDFPALDSLNNNADETMSCFKEFLNELKKDVIEKKILGTIVPLVPDHMFREECYYLTKLSMVSNIKKPECDPTKSRVES